MRFWGWLGLAGCFSGQGSKGEDADVSKVIGSGTREETGVLAFLNDEATTVSLLDVDVALDSRAANHLIVHRNGPDGAWGTSDDRPFLSIEEVDAIAYVGDAALRALLAFAEAHGWIPADSEVYGVVEGIELTQSQAVDVLRVANGATLDELDLDAGLDARAAAGILENRPFGTVEDVAAVSYVGPAALNKLIDWGSTHPVVLLDGEIALPVLEIATAGLWFTSESDYPLEIWGLPGEGEPIPAEEAKEILEAAYVQREDEPTWDERELEISSLDWFFHRYTEQQDWWEESQIAGAPKWRALREVFETQLDQPQVFRVGRPQGDHLVGAIEIFVVGVTRDGDWVGIRTVSVET